MKNYLTTLLLLIIFTNSVLSQTFVHPGILHTQEDFDRMAEKVNANEEPWIGSYNLLINKPEAQLNWSPRATETVIRGGTGDNVSLLYRDVQAAYQHALIYKITGNTANGDKARDILNAWSSTHTTLTGNADRYLASGLFGYQFANAAEMMRDYSGFNVSQFQNYLLNVYYYPLVERFLVGNSHGEDHNDACITNYWANWDLANMAAMIAIGVFCDNQAIYDQGIEYYKNGAGNGSITHAIPYVHSSTMAQWQESGRDQGHTILGIGLMATFCEIAWNQGDDMYGWDDNRFRKAANYVAAYNNNQSVPYTLYSWGSGQNCAYNEQPAISSAGRGEERPVWEMIYNHYANEKGQENLIPWVSQEAADLRAEGGPGGHATTYDQPGFGSLTHYGEDNGNGCNPTSITPNLQVNGESWQTTTSITIDSGDQIKFGPQPVSGGLWSWIGCGTTGSSREQTVTLTNSCSATVTYTNECGTQSSVTYEITVNGSEPGGSTYQLRNQATGLYLDGMSETENGEACGQWANTTSTNAQWDIQEHNGNYTIQNVATDLYLDGMGRTANGDDVGQWDNVTNTNAQWNIEQYEGNYYRIQNVTTSLYLDGMGETENGAVCGQWANTTSTNAQWELIPVSVSPSSSSLAKTAILTEEEIVSSFSDINFYPNPVSLKLSLVLPEDFQTGVARIFDLGGKLYAESKVSKTKSEVNVSDLKPGVYVLKIAINNTNQSWDGKFIKR